MKTFSKLACSSLRVAEIAFSFSVWSLLMDSLLIWAAMNSFSLVMSSFSFRNSSSWYLFARRSFYSSLLFSYSIICLRCSNLFAYSLFASEYWKCIALHFYSSLLFSSFICYIWDISSDFSLTSCSFCALAALSSFSKLIDLAELFSDRSLY